jgi:DNA polymerase-3 subunit alpha
MAGLAELPAGRQVTIGGVVTGVRGQRDKRGHDMAFFTLEDYTGAIEVIAFSSVYETARPLVHSDVPILVTGRLDRRDDETGKVVAEAIVPLAQAATEGERRLEVRVPREKCEQEILNEVRSVLLRNSGSMPVTITIDTGASRAILATDLRVALHDGLLEPLATLLGPGNVRLAEPPTTAAARTGNGHAEKR